MHTDVLSVIRMNDRRGCRCVPRHIKASFLGFDKGHHAIAANNIDLACASYNGVAFGAVHPAVAAPCRGGGCGGSACVATVRSDGNHLTLGNRTVHFNLSEFVHMVDHKLENRVTRSGARPSVFVGAGNGQAVFFGCALELLIVVYSIVGCVLDVANDVHQVTSFMYHTCNNILNGAGIQVGGTDV